MIYTEKQLALMRIWQKHGLKRINILEGSVSSGKTWISLVLWAFWVKTQPENEQFLMCAKSLTTLKRNCLLLLQDLIGDANFSFSLSTKQGELFGRTVFFEGANDERAESKIRGMTLQGAYCDELTQFPEGFFTMLLSRLRRPNAKLIGTTNPDSPMHWLKEDYLDRQNELSVLSVRFNIDDNTTLTEDYVDNIKKEYTGVFYRRYILGEWCVAEGLVYEFGEENITDDIPESGDYYISVDYGTQNPFAALLWCMNGDKAVLVKEYYYSGRQERKQKTDEEYCDAVIELADGYKVRQVVVDPSAASFIEALRRRKMSVAKAQNDVIDGIRVTASCLKNGNIMIHRSCKHTIEEFGLYSWDDKAGEDRVIKENDHCLTGDTQIETLFGKRRIKDLVGKIGLVWSYKNGKKCLRPFWGARKTRNKQTIIRITTDNGKTISCTKDHKILTAEGWKKAGEITPNDLIVDTFNEKGKSQ